MLLTKLKVILTFMLLMTSSGLALYSGFASDGVGNSIAAQDDRAQTIEIGDEPSENRKEDNKQAGEKNGGAGGEAFESATAAAQFAEPVLFGRIIDTLVRAETNRAAPPWPDLLPLLGAWVGFGLFTIICGALAALTPTAWRIAAATAC